MKGIFRILLITALGIVPNILISQTTKNPGDRLSASQISHDLQKNKSIISPNSNPEGLINIDKSGDVSMSVPLVNVVGRKLQLPIQLNYAAGIKVNQKSSEVGLGWSINFGSIVRDYGAFEPDYAETTAEAKMINTIQPSGGNNFAGPGQPLHSFDHKYDPIYSGVVGGGSTNKMTPDDYHINIPGVGGNTFWNKGNENAPHDFVFNHYKPWEIEHAISGFTISQEYSRINELTFLTDLSGKLRSDANIAAAIMIPPYVNGRSFKEAAPLPGGFFTDHKQSNVEYRDFEKFTITTEDGTQYIFGRPLRGQKYVFDEDPFWSAHIQGTINSPGMSRGEFWKIDYIAEWLLTEVRSVDYVDSNENGQLDDADEGDWIKIEYTKPLETEFIKGSKVSPINVPTHREWLNFTQTDIYSSLMRERAYVTKITTPVQEIEFIKSPKMDVDHDHFGTILNNPTGAGTNGENYYYSKHNIISNSQNGDALRADYPMELYKYDKVIIKEKKQDDKLYVRNKITNTIVLNYAEKGSSDELAVSNYLIRNNKNKEHVTYVPDRVAPSNGFDIEDYNVVNSVYNGGVGRGKTTLLGVDFYPEDNTTTADKRSYQFEYGYNPSFDEIHKFEILKANAYPTLRASASNTSIRGSALNTQVKNSMSDYIMHQYRYDSGNGNIIQYSNQGASIIGIDKMGYYEDLNPNNPNLQNWGRDAWSLTKVILPSGGSVELEYGTDQFQYDDDRREWHAKGAILDDMIPFVEHYNTLARFRSVLQDRANEVCGVNKALYRSFSYPMEDITGGIRLKKQILDDGVNPVKELKYEYGPGHYSSVPASYWRNYISAFSSFMVHESERQLGEAQYSPYFAAQGFISKNDFNTFMAPLSMNVRIDNTVKDNHYYEFINEVSVVDPNSINNPYIKKTFGTPYQNGNSNYFDKQKMVWIKGEERVLKPIVMMLTNNIELEQEVQLLKVEKFEASVAIPYETTSFNWTLYNNVEQVNHKLNYGKIVLPSSTYPVWIKNPSQELTQFLPDPHPIIKVLRYIINIVTLPPYLPATGGFTVFDNPSQNILYRTQQLNDMISYIFTGSANDCEDLKVIPLIYDDLFTIDEVPGFKRQQSIRQNLIQQTTTYNNIESKTDYTYEPTYNFLKTTTVKNSNYSYTSGAYPISQKIINETSYAFEDYNGISTKFTNAHLLNAVTQTKQYFGSIAPANLLKASVQTWDVDPLGGIPRPNKSYSYNGSINSEGMILGYTPFNFTLSQTNTNDDWQLQNEGVIYNQFGQNTLSKTNNIHTKSVLGYNSSQPKATISSTKGKFDATYTGFEDHYFDQNKKVDLGEKKQEEFWYEQNDFEEENYALMGFGLSPQVGPANYATYASNYGCNSYVHYSSGVNVINLPPVWRQYIYFTLDNSILNLGLGETIIIKPNPNAPVPAQSLMPTWTTTIDRIQPANNGLHSICFSGPLPSTWVYHLEPGPTDPLLGPRNIFIFNDMIIQKGTDLRTSKVVNNQGHTGNSSYYLSPREEVGDPAQKTPVRPVKIAPIGE